MHGAARSARRSSRWPSGPRCSRRSRRFPLLPPPAAAHAAGGPRLAARAVDLVISLSHCVAKAVVPPPGVPHVCYCFTPMRYAWQGRDAYLESWSDRPIRRRSPGPVARAARAMGPRDRRRVTHFVAISETVRQRIRAVTAATAGSSSRRSNVDFYTPVAGRRSRRTTIWSSRHWSLTSGSTRRCRVHASGRRLIVIGKGPERERLERRPAGRSVRFLGWQPERGDPRPLRRCRALLFPGEEDFGIVPVEAIACGTPVMAPRQGGGTAETIDGKRWAGPTRRPSRPMGFLMRNERMGTPRLPGHDPVPRTAACRGICPTAFPRAAAGFSGRRSWRPKAGARDAAGTACEGGWSIGSPTVENPPLPSRPRTAMSITHLLALLVPISIAAAKAS